MSVSDEAIHTMIKSFESFIESISAAEREGMSTFHLSCVKAGMEDDVKQLQAELAEREFAQHVRA